jgi:hypothetical protein
LVFKFEGVGEVLVELDPTRNPKTVNQVLEALPFNATAQRWGDEVYFTTPIRVGEESSQEVVEVGTLAYWPPGRALCLFFGPTPASQREEPRAASPVNPVGRVVQGLELLPKVESECRVEVAVAEG